MPPGKTSVSTSPSPPVILRSYTYPAQRGEASGAETIGVRHPRDYRAMIGLLKPIINGIVDAVKGDRAEPDEINVELGIGFTSSFETVLASLSGQANL